MKRSGPFRLHCHRARLNVRLLAGGGGQKRRITELQSVARQFHQGTDDAEIAKLLGQEVPPQSEIIVSSSGKKTGQGVSGANEFGRQTGRRRRTGRNTEVHG